MLADPVAARRADQRQPRLDRDLFGEVGCGAVAATDDRPDVILVNHPRDSRDARLPGVVRPGRDQAERHALVATLGVGLADRKLGGLPEITAIGMIRVARAEVTEEHLGHVGSSLRSRPGPS